MKPSLTQQQEAISIQPRKYLVAKGSRGIYDARNSLNELTGKEWLLFTKSWFISNPPPRKKQERAHPAKFPESVVSDFISFFTRERSIVLDPMVGSGSSLVACAKMNRIGIGIELTSKWAEIAKERIGQSKGSSSHEQFIIVGDARQTKCLLQEKGISQVDFCITSPPYWNMLTKSRGHVRSEAHKRREQGLPLHYSDDFRDFGNIDSYEMYLDSMQRVFSEVHSVLRDKGYLVIVVQNVLSSGGEMVPLAWDLARRLASQFVLKQERIWLQDSKPLGCWGYPWSYVSNVHHHYCLIFKKDDSLRKPKVTGPSFI
jgi:DNA modification methylase